MAKPEVTTKSAGSFLSLEMIASLLCLAGLLGGWLTERHLDSWWIPKACFLVAYIAGGGFATASALKALRGWVIEVDLLMILAALGAAYVGAPLEGAVLLFLFSLSNALQDYAIDRSRRAVRAIMDLRPTVAMVRRDGALVEVPSAELVPGDQVVVRPGERIPSDGVVLEGTSSVDQSSMTGESIPVDRGPGTTVYGGTVALSGGFEMKVTSGPDQSLLSRMVALVETAQANKARSQRFLEKAEQRYAAGVIAFTAFLMIAPLLWGVPWNEAVYKAMTVMVVMSPCALVISIPATILSAIAGAAWKGILFKGGAHLERAATVEIVAFDKTGTLTSGKPRVCSVSTWGELAAEDVLSLGASVSQRSEHPIARAFVTEAQARSVSLLEITDFRSFAGHGTEAVINGRRISVGNMRSLVADGGCGDIIAHAADIDRVAAKGETPVGIAERLPDGSVRVLGMVTVADTPREDAKETIALLRRSGIKKIVMITGDDRRVAQAVAAQLGIDDVRAELLPEDKVKVVNSLLKEGPVAMVGDGVNDAPSLAAATVGVAMGGGGTDIALETADIVIMGNRLGNIANAFDLSRRARTVVIQNLVFASGVMLILTVIALSGQLPLTLGVVGHEGSTVLVCLNGLRLLATGIKS
jgi:Cd2+/Zn2+-exporting ATPase